MRKAGIAKMKRNILDMRNNLTIDELNDVKKMSLFKEYSKTNDLLREDTEMHNLLAESL